MQLRTVPTRSPRKLWHCCTSRDWIDSFRAKPLWRKEIQHQVVHPKWQPHFLERLRPELPRAGDKKNPTLFSYEVGYCQRFDLFFFHLSAGAKWTSVYPWNFWCSRLQPRQKELSTSLRESSLGHHQLLDETHPELEQRVRQNAHSLIRKPDWSTEGTQRDQVACRLLTIIHMNSPLIASHWRLRYRRMDIIVKKTAKNCNHGFPVDSENRIEAVDA